MASNPCFPDYVKIGISESCKVAELKRRLRELSGTNVPASFELHYAAIVDDPKGKEDYILAAYDGVRENKRREFLKIDPNSVRVMMRGIGGKEVNLDSEASIRPGEVAFFRDAKRRANTRRDNFQFVDLGIPIGAKLVFIDKESITCEVVENNMVKYEDDVMTLSAAANTVLEERGKFWGVAGPRYWKYQNETVLARRDRLESESD